MSYLPFTRQLRFQGGHLRGMGDADGAAVIEEAEREAALEREAGGGGNDAVRQAVDQSNSNAAPIQQTIDRSSTTITSPEWRERAQRVSPLGQSWQFPIGPPGQGYVIQPGGIGVMGTVVVAAVAVATLGVIYYALKGD